MRVAIGVHTRQPRVEHAGTIAARKVAKRLHVERIATGEHGVPDSLAPRVVMDSDEGCAARRAVDSGTRGIASVVALTKGNAVVVVCRQARIPGAPEIGWCSGVGSHAAVSGALVDAEVSRDASVHAT